MNTISFEKYQGAGNDFIMIDNRTGHFPKQNARLIAAMCRRRFGIGADGLILIEQAPQAHFKMIYFNADGYEGSLCGNGARCAVAFAHKHGICPQSVVFEAYDGMHEAKVLGKEVKLKMQDVRGIEQMATDACFLDTGSPHYVQWVHNLPAFPVLQEGRRIRYGEPFGQKGTNVNFIEQKDNNTIAIRTYERGVEDETYACGTGATAAALVAALRGMTSPLRVEALGGTLTVYFHRQSSEHFTDIYLQGPATFVFSGEYPLSTDTMAAPPLHFH